MAGLMRTRLRYLLYTAWLSKRRAYDMKRSRMAKGLDLCIAGWIVYNFYQRLWLVVHGSVSSRMGAAKILILLLGVLWFLVPLTLQPEISIQSLASYPYTRREINIYRLISHWLDWKAVALLVISLIGVIAVGCLPNGFILALGAAGSLLIAGGCGTALLALDRTALRAKERRTPEYKCEMRTRRYALFHKEIFYYSRTLDPYIALLISFSAAYTEIAGRWMTPAKVMVPMILVSTVQIAAVLNPFALEKIAEQERYREMPLSLGRILVHKYAALTGILFITELPIVIAVVWQLAWMDGLTVLVELSVILLSYGLTGIVLMRMPMARRVRMRMGGMSEGFVLEIVLPAIALNLAFPVAILFLTLGRSSELHVVISLAMMCGMCGIYFRLLRRQAWTECRT